MYLAKTSQQFLVDDEGEVDKIKFECLISKTVSENILCCTPPHPEEEWDYFKIKQFIAGPFTVKPTLTNKFSVEGYKDIVKLFINIKKYVVCF